MDGIVFLRVRDSGHRRTDLLRAGQTAGALSFKALLVGLRALRHVPGAEAAMVWGMSLLASMAGVVFQINTFAYHSVLRIFFGLVGAWCSAIRHHRPELRLTWRDLIIIVAACATYALFVLPVFLRLKGDA